MIRLLSATVRAFCGLYTLQAALAERELQAVAMFLVACYVIAHAAVDVIAGTED